MDSRAKARSGLIIFFAVLIPGSAYFEHKILVLGGSIQNHLGIIFGLVWWVTVSSIVARIVLGESSRDVSFRWGGSAGTRAMAVATAMPLVVGFVAYGIGWSSGLANFGAHLRSLRCSGDALYFCREPPCEIFRVPRSHVGIWRASHLQVCRR